MKQITILLALHKYDSNYEIMLKNAIQSCEQFYNDVKLMIIHPNSLYDHLKLSDLSNKLEIELVGHEDSTDFCSQINVGIEECDTEWLSILEVDDEYTPNWLYSMNAYRKENENVDVFLPIVKDINVEGKFIAYMNESTWAHGFSSEEGILTNDLLLDYLVYQTSGGLYKTTLLKENKGFKTNMKVTFGYELLLRLTHNGARIMTVPKVGYIHVNLRGDSLFDQYRNSEENKIDEMESKFWLDTAKREFFFKNQREVNYKKT